MEQVTGVYVLHDGGSLGIRKDVGAVPDDAVITLRRGSRASDRMDLKAELQKGSKYAPADEATGTCQEHPIQG
jgi:hypothetical protein